MNASAASILAGSLVLAACRATPPGGAANETDVAAANEDSDLMADDSDAPCVPVVPLPEVCGLLSWAPGFCEPSGAHFLWPMTEYLAVLMPGHDVPPLDLPGADARYAGCAATEYDELWIAARYDAAGTVRERGGTAMRYDASCRLVSGSPNGQVWSQLTYDGNGRIATREDIWADHNGEHDDVYRFTYADPDNDGRIDQIDVDLRYGGIVFQPLESWVLTWDADHLVRTELWYDDELFDVQAWGYDASGRLISTSEGFRRPLEPLKSFVYDDQGRVVETRNWDDAIWLTWDGDRVAHIERGYATCTEDEAGSHAACVRWTFDPVYDASDRIISGPTADYTSACAR